MNRAVIFFVSLVLLVNFPEISTIVAQLLKIDISIIKSILILGMIIPPLTLVLRFYTNIPEGHVGVISQFGGFTKTFNPGFNLLFPWEKVDLLSIQNRAIELKFQAITLDQASVYFNCTILYSVIDTDKEKVRNAFYSFATKEEFELSVQRLLEDETRAYVATKRQAEMIGISQDVVIKIKQNVDSKIEQWGYQVEDLRYNNLHFDEVVTRSMARVVAAVNEKEAAENEGQALLIRKVKEAEADGEFVRIQADAEKTAWKLRGEGLSDFRQEVAKGVHIAVNELTRDGLDPNYLLFFMYTETLKHIAENSGAGSTIFVDSNPSSPNTIMQQMSAFYSNDSMNSQHNKMGDKV